MDDKYKGLEEMDRDMAMLKDRFEKEQMEEEPIELEEDADNYKE